MILFFALREQTHLDYTSSIKHRENDELVLPFIIKVLKKNGNTYMNIFIKANFCGANLMQIG